MYKVLTRNSVEISIFKEDDKMFIPIDEGNRHYQEYLEWLEEGNTPTYEEIQLPPTE